MIEPNTHNIVILLISVLRPIPKPALIPTFNTLPTRIRLDKFVSCTADQFAKVLLPEAPKWFELGQCLGISNRQLKKIQRTLGNNDRRCLTELHDSFTRKGNPITWKRIATALRRLGNNTLADFVHSSYILRAIQRDSSDKDNTTSTGIL